MGRIREWGVWGTVWRVGVGMVLLVVGVIVFCPPLEEGREAARRRAVKQNLELLATKAGVFAFEHETLPSETPEGEERVWSWEVQLLPYLEEKQLFNQIHRDVDWDDEANREVFATGVNSFTHYKLTAGGPTIGYSANDQLINNTAPVAIQNVTDGLSTTMIFGEIREHLPKWGEPGNFRDVTLGINRSPRGFGGAFPGGAFVSFLDGHVDFLSGKIDRKVLEALATPSGGERVLREEF